MEAGSKFAANARATANVLTCPQIFAKKTSNRKNVFRVARSMYGQDNMDAIMFLKNK